MNKINFFEYVELMKALEAKEQEAKETSENTENNKNNKIETDNYVDLFKKIPFGNYYILGYITISMLIYASFFVDIFESETNYSFYLILRWLVTIFALWSAYKIYKIKPESKLIGIALLAVIFNPITMISFERTTWQIIDVITALLFVKVMSFKKETKPETSNKAETDLKKDN